MKREEYEELCNRRIMAYVDMLKEAYQVDNHGLADMIGVNRGTFTKFLKADFTHKTVTPAFELAKLTGISLDWLVAREVEFSYLEDMKR